jgi:RHS repeat-associated protein
MNQDVNSLGDGSLYPTEFRMFDPRLGRWMSLDPLMDQFPWMSLFVGMDNNPISLTDPYGLNTIEKDTPAEGGGGSGGEGDKPKPDGSKQLKTKPKWWKFWSKLKKMTEDNSEPPLNDNTDYTFRTKNEGDENSDIFPEDRYSKKDVDPNPDRNDDDRKPKDKKFDRDFDSNPDEERTKKRQKHFKFNGRNKFWEKRTNQFKIFQGWGIGFSLEDPNWGTHWISFGFANYKKYNVFGKSRQSSLPINDRIVQISHLVKLVLARHNIVQVKLRFLCKPLAGQ